MRCTHIHSKQRATQSHLDPNVSFYSIWLQCNERHKFNRCRCQFQRDNLPFHQWHAHNNRTWKLNRDEHLASFFIDLTSNRLKKKRKTIFTKTKTSCIACYAKDDNISFTIIEPADLNRLGIISLCLSDFMRQSTSSTQMLRLRYNA